MSYLRKAISKYFRKPKTYDVTELAENPEITDEIEKVLLELNGKMGLESKEIEEAISSLKKRKNQKD